MDHGFLYQALVYLAAAVVSVPIAKRLGLGSVLGYLVAGIVIGPFALGFVGTHGQDVMHFAEIGVVMMLFLIGLELQPSLLWKLRASLFGLGGLQVVVTGAAGCAIGSALGFPWQTSLAVGLILAMSSTAIVLQTLNETSLLKTPGGQSAFAVLLFQDMAVIPILALLPLLAIDPIAPLAAAEPGHARAGQHAITILLAVVAIVVAGRYLLRPVFRWIAGTKIRELFTATALLLVVAVTMLMNEVGLSPALGAFLGGVVLANSEYRHELVTDIEPFKGLLLGLFFISVGATIDFHLLVEHPLAMAGLVFMLLAVKAVVLTFLGRAFGLKGPANLLFSLGLAQAGEFAFVLFSFAQQGGILSQNIVAPLTAAVAMTMALTPILFVVYKRLAPLWATDKKAEREADRIEEHDHPVIVAGFGRFGSTVGRYLRSHGIGATVLDLDPEQVDTLRRIGLKVYYGDASRTDLLRAAGADQAKLLIVAVDDPAKTREITNIARKHFPHLKLLVRVQGRALAYELIKEGIPHVYREVFDSALHCADEAFRMLGGGAERAAWGMRIFRERDERKLREMAHLWGDDDNFYEAARQTVLEEERLLLIGIPEAEPGAPEKSV